MYEAEAMNVGSGKILICCLGFFCGRISTLTSHNPNKSCGSTDWSRQPMERSFVSFSSNASEHESNFFAAIRHASGFFKQRNIISTWPMRFWKPYGFVSHSYNMLPYSSMILMVRMEVHQISAERTTSVISISRPDMLKFGIKLNEVGHLSHQASLS